VTPRGFDGRRGSERPSVQRRSLLVVVAVMAVIAVSAGLAASAARSTGDGLLVIDPFIQQGKKLTGGGAAAVGSLGSSVVLSADGNTALVGGPSAGGGDGAAWVFTRAGSTWSPQGKKLTAGIKGSGERFGRSVALSADGNTALVGGCCVEVNSDAVIGAVWVFARSGSTWTQQGEKLTGGGGFGSSVALSGDGNTALMGVTGGFCFCTGTALVFVRSGSTWTRQGEGLTGSGVTAGGRMGRSVALSADGNTAVVGGPSDNGGIGAAWVFGRSGSAWTQLGTKLTGSDETGPGGFGSSVALSADGLSALVGGPADGGEVGAAWVFGRSGSAWTQQGAKLTGSGGIGRGARFGSSVALSADGLMALIGGPADLLEVGAAWVFGRSDSAWTQQGEKLTGSDEIGRGGLGGSVALSADAGTALIGGPADGGEAGAAWVFGRSGSAWTQQGAKLTGSGGTGAAEFGWRVALSADGNTALIGGPDDSNQIGAAWVFTRSGSTWRQQGAKLTGGIAVDLAWVDRGAVGRGRFGSSVALSADGNTALIGGPDDDNRIGAAWVFTRSGSTWRQVGAKLRGSGAVGSSSFGTSVALSGDGRTALIGGRYDYGRVGGRWGVGAAWVFTRSGSAWRQQGEKLTGMGGITATFGSSVALSADGNTALIGGPQDNGSQGAAWMFTRSGSTWSQRGKKMIEPERGEVSRGGFGASVALSADGNAVLIAGGSHAWVFARSGPNWRQQGKKLNRDDAKASVQVAAYIASATLSSDGKTALIGRPLDHDRVGAAWAFTLSGSTWSQQSKKLTGSGGAGAGGFGSSTALSADGTTALLGGPDDSREAGAAWVFRSGGRHS
jgi:hypothetical protein